MRLGRCIDLEALEPNIVQGGGATATWTPITATHATLDIHLPPGRSCPGGDEGAEIDPYATCTIKFKGCGQLHITAAGTGASTTALPAAYTQLTLRDGTTLSGQPSITLQSGVDGLTCESAGLEGEGDATFKVGCGMELFIAFLGATALTPACDVSFDIQVES